MNKRKEIPNLPAQIDAIKTLIKRYNKGIRMSYGDKYTYKYIYKSLRIGAIDSCTLCLLNNNYCDTCIHYWYSDSLMYLPPCSNTDTFPSINKIFNNQSLRLVFRERIKYLNKIINENS